MVFFSNIQNKKIVLFCNGHNNKALTNILLTNDIIAMPEMISFESNRGLIRLKTVSVLVIFQMAVRHMCCLWLHICVLFVTQALFLGQLDYNNLDHPLEKWFVQFFVHFDWVLQRHPSHPPTKKPAMNLCVILIEWLLVYASRAETDQAARPTQDMLISGLSDHKHYYSIFLRAKGISYLPADTFVDFPNITVRCACLRSPGYNH